MNKATCLLLSALFVPSFAFAESYALEVNGMKCDHCAKRLQGELKALKGVGSVSVGLKVKQVALDTLEGQHLQEEQVRKPLIDSGFSLVEVTEADDQADHRAHHYAWRNSRKWDLAFKALNGVML